MIARPWRPRCCASCGEPLEEWKWPLRVGAYIACQSCARFYVVTEDGLEPVLLSLEAPELQRVFEELLQAWWQLQGRRQSERVAA